MSTSYGPAPLSPRNGVKPLGDYHAVSKEDGYCYTHSSLECKNIPGVWSGMDRIKQHQEWMETESRFAHACPDIDQEFPTLEMPQPLSDEEWASVEAQDDWGEPDEAINRKQYPLARGLLDYFPQALMEVAHCSLVCNEQHNPGEPMHWAYEKSTDEADALMRHLIDRGKFDKDGIRHSAKVAWRALAMLERELNGEKEIERIE